jgi:tetratricopeptide (TPR) repeat protein
VERVAILPLENLSADADASWIGRAVSSIAAARTLGDPAVRTFEAATLRDAALQHATRTVLGYFATPGGGIAIQGTVRNESERQNVQSFRASGTDVFALAEAVAARTGAPLHPYTTKSVQAVEALYRGIAAEEPESAVTHIERAIALDPQFGSAHVARIELLVRTGRTPAARELLGRALAARLTALEKARLDVLAAEVAGDSKARLGAIMRVAELQPGDSELWRTLANGQMEIRDFQAALRSFGRVLELNPADEDALNLRAYASTFAGDADGALRALREYRQTLPDSANAIDSQGEISFYFGRYAEASRLFLEAHAKNPAVVGGVEPLRAAFAMFMAGDLNAADKLSDEYYAALRQRGDPIVDLRAAVWRFLTGRPTGTLPATPFSHALQALWALNAGDRPTAAALATKTRSGARDPVTANTASLTVLLSQPSATPEAWKERVQKAVPAPEAAAERDRLLGWALLLDNQPAAAAEVWRRFLTRSSPLVAHEARLILAWALTDAGQMDEARKLVPHGFIPPSNFDPSLSSLAWARARDILQKIH